MAEIKKYNLAIAVVILILLAGSIISLVGLVNAAYAGIIGVAFSAFLAVTPIIPPKLILRSYLLLSIFIMGLLQYYLKQPQISNISHVLALGLSWWGLARWALNRGSPGLPPSLMVFLIIMLYWVVQSILTGASFDQDFAGVFTIWFGFSAICGLYIAIVNGGRPAVEWVIGLLTLLPLVELPFVLHQRLFLLRGSTSWDAVTGTFGGIPPDTGNSSALMVFLIVAVLWAVQRIQAGRMSYTLGAVIVLSVFAITMLGETKAFFIMMPLALVVQNYSYFFKRPVASLFYGVVFVAALLSIMKFYEVNNYQARYADMTAMSPWERLSASFEKIMSTDSPSQADGELTRAETIAVWAKKVESDTGRQLLGYGLGASREGSLSTGAAAAMFPQVKLNSTALAQMLWDVGVIGTSIFLLFMVGRMLYLLIASSRTRDRALSSFLRTNAAVIATLLFTIPYKNMIMEVLPIQSLLALTLIISSLPNRFIVAPAKQR